jgi:hypothetical protein
MRFAPAHARATGVARALLRAAVTGLPDTGGWQGGGATRQAIDDRHI